MSVGRAFARQVDDHPADARLWSQHRGILEVLGDADDADRRTIDAETEVEAGEFVRHLASVGAAEAERARRYREADTDDERHRWARLVPVGCARGEHVRVDRPGGAVACPDCAAVLGVAGWGEIPGEPIITTTNPNTDLRRSPMCNTATAPTIDIVAEVAELVPLALVAAELGETVDQLAARVADEVVPDDIGFRCVSAATAWQIVHAFHASREAWAETQRRQTEQRRAARAKHPRASAQGVAASVLADTGFADDPAGAFAAVAREDAKNGGIAPRPSRLDWLFGNADTGGTIRVPNPDTPGAA